MSYWSGEKLFANSGVIKDFDPEQVDANAYNLRMGDRYFRTADQESKADQTKVFLEKDQPFSIPPGQFAFLLTRETVNVPADAMAFISLRTGIKFQGVINVSGFHVDPGYSGKLLYAVYNASPAPVQICEGEAIFKIWFADLDRKSERLFRGAGQNDIPGSLISRMNRAIYSMQALADQMRDLKLELEKQKPTIDTLMFIWRGIIMAVMIAAVVGLLTFALPILYAGGQWVARNAGLAQPLNERAVAKGAVQTSEQPASEGGTAGETHNGVADPMK
jgi:dCTP deaminase